MTDRLKHLIGMKGGIYKRFKNWEIYLKENYTTLTRLAWKNQRKSEEKIRMRVARNA